VPGRGPALEQWLQRQGQLLAQLHPPPLVERVDPEDHPLDEHPMLVERDDLAEGTQRRQKINGVLRLTVSLRSKRIVMRKTSMARI